MFKFMQVLRNTLVLSGVLGFTNCGGGGGGGDPKPPPPPPATYTDMVNGSQGIVVSPPSATGVTGEMKVYSVTLPTGYIDPVANPSGGTFSNGITVGTYNFALAIGSSNRTFTVSATPPTPLYSISGKVFGAENVLVTLVTQDGAFISSTITNVDGFFIFPDLTNGNRMLKLEKFGYVFSPTYRNVGINNANSVGNDFTASFVNSSAHFAIMTTDHDNTGSPNNNVIGVSLHVLSLGTKIEGFAMMPGKTSFTQTFAPIIVDSSGDGKFAQVFLHSGVPFYNPDGTLAASGIATYRIDTTINGVVSSVTAEVPVLMGTVLLGPLQAVNKLSNGDLELVGSFPDPPIVILGSTTGYGYTITVASPYGQNYSVPIPAKPGYSGPIIVVVLSGRRCSTLVFAQ